MPMPTNNEIIRKYDLAGNGELGIDVYDALDEARADTAKQIFDELEAMTLKASGKCNNPMCIYGDEAEEQYWELKKEYNIEE